MSWLLLFSLEAGAVSLGPKTPPELAFLPRSGATVPERPVFWIRREYAWGERRAAPLVRMYTGPDTPIELELVEVRDELWTVRPVAALSPGTELRLVAWPDRSTPRNAVIVASYHVAAIELEPPPRPDVRHLVNVGDPPYCDISRLEVEVEPWPNAAGWLLQGAGSRRALRAGAVTPLDIEWLARPGKLWLGANVGALRTGVQFRGCWIFPDREVLRWIVLSTVGLDGSISPGVVRRVPRLTPLHRRRRHP